MQHHRAPGIEQTIGSILYNKIPCNKLNNQSIHTGMDTKARTNSQNPSNPQPDSHPVVLTLQSHPVCQVLSNDC